MDGKQSARRRVSASTTAPSAPSASSSQRNQKRSWPGVPKRYSTISPLMLIRPKSMATVVVVLRSTPVRSSTSTPTLVRTSSVCRGWISLTAPTRVVLPTPKPPAIRILTAVGCCSEGSEAIDNRLEDAFVGSPRAVGFVDRDEPLLQEVVEEHPHDPDREVEVAGQFRDGDRRLGAVEDGLVLRKQEHTGRGVVDGLDEGDEVDRRCLAPTAGPAARPSVGPAAGHRVRADDRAGLGVEP